MYIKKVLIHTHIPNVLPFLGLSPKGAQRGVGRRAKTTITAVGSGELWKLERAETGGDGGEAVTGSFLEHFMGKSWENHWDFHGKIIGSFFWMEFHACFFGTSLEFILMGIHGGFKGKFHGS